MTAVLSDSIIWRNLAGGAAQWVATASAAAFSTVAPLRLVRRTYPLSIASSQTTAQGAHGGGHGVGGGVYNVGVFAFDAATVIDHNQASTSNGDVFP